MESMYVYRVVVDNDEEYWVVDIDDLFAQFGETVTSITRYTLVEETAISINTMEPFIGD